jgi:hypothetical protein
MTTESRVDATTDSFRQRRLLGWLAVLAGILAAILWLYFAAPSWWEPIRAEDISQARLDVAPAPARPESFLRQSFIPLHDGLDAIEITLAHTGAGNGSGGSLTLQVTDDAGRTIAVNEWRNAELRHNQKLELALPPQSGSAGRTYTLSVHGNEANTYSAWATSLDVYSHGSLDGAPGAADLQFTTRYRLLPASFLRSLSSLAGEGAAIILLTLLLLLLPGSTVLLLAARRLPRLDPAAWLALALALGTAFWPLVWQWTAVIGWRWRATSLWFLLVALVVLSSFLLWRRRPRLGRIRWHHLLLAFLLVLGFAVRLLAVRDLAFPPWVDSSRHALITVLMSERGQMPDDYLPYLPVSRTLYHYGFHSVAASLNILGDWDVPRLLLFAGQTLGAAVPLALYGATYIVTRRPWASLLAAFLVAFPFYFPAYYVTWGRYTQLTGVLILPLLISLTWQPLRGARRWRGAWPLLALLAAGLALLHFRVFLLYLLFVPLALMAARGRAARTVVVAGLVGAMLAGPYLAQLGRQTGVGDVLNTPPASYASFPTGYLTIGWERAFWWLAALTWLAALFAATRGRAWARLPLLLAAWVGVMFLAFTGVLPNTWLINLNSAYIIFFVPVAFLLAIGAEAIRRAVPHTLAVRVVVTAIATFVLAVALLFGARQQITIVNPTTILVYPADVPAIEWARANLPPDARIAINAWQWLGKTWAGSDGGAWLLPLTGLETTTPPVDYTNSRALILEVDAFNQVAQGVDDWSQPAAADWLRTQGVTHVFTGARGGFLDPAALLRSSELCSLYARDGVFVFGLRAGGSAVCPP